MRPLRRAGWWCCIRGKLPPTAPRRKYFPRWTCCNRLGLAAPDTVELCWELDRKGFRLPLDRLTIEECGQATLRVGNGLTPWRNEH